MSPSQDWLRRNLALLAACQPALAALVEGVEPESYELVQTRSGHPSARFGGRLLHSAYDPRLEARRLAESCLTPGVDTAIILGSGLGYLAEAAFDLGSLDHLLICESSLPRLAALLASRDLSELLSDQRLSWIVEGDPGAILAALDEFGTKKIGVLSLRPLEELDAEWYAALRAAIDRFASKEAINENTLRRFGRLWVRNLARNARSIAELPGINNLKGRFEGLPALVLAAGPSLDAVIPRLRELRERCLLIAVDTALRSLLSQGIEPDFLVVVDPQYWNWRHLADLDSPHSLLVSEPAVWPSVLRTRHRRAFLASSLFPLGRALEGGDRGTLGAGGSVATSAWDFARHLGCLPIFMAGLDLGYPEGQTHARASLFEQRALGAGRRLSPASTSQAAALFGAPTRLVPANDGGLLTSDQRMTLYAWWFEARLARPESPRTLSLSKRGMAIPGMGRAEIDELLSLGPRREEIDELLSKAATIDVTQGAIDAGKQALDTLLADLGRIAELAEVGLAAATQASVQLRSGGNPRAALEALDRVDADIHASEFRDVAGFLLPPLADLLGGRPSSLVESLATSERLYRSIAASAREHIEILECHAGTTLG